MLHLGPSASRELGPSLPGCSLGKYPRQHYPRRAASTPCSHEVDDSALPPQSLICHELPALILRAAIHLMLLIFLLAGISPVSASLAISGHGPTSVAYSGTGGGIVNYTSHDNNGNLLSLNENGANTISRTYDGLNRVTSYTHAGQTLGYRYYPSGKLAKLIYPGGTENATGHVEYTYDSHGRLYQVIDKLNSTTSPRTTTYLWNPDGRLASVTRPNGTVNGVRVNQSTMSDQFVDPRALIPFTERGTLFIRQGKGRKDRMVPVGDRALHWITRYRDDIRPQYVREPDSGTLFLTNLYEPFTPNRLTQLVRDYINAAELGKSGSCHLFRHTCATLMLENGADIRFIQQLLGHAELTTTQIYTQVSIQKLKQVHSACHPSSNLEKPTDRKP